MPVMAQIRQVVASGNYFDAAALLKSSFAPLHTRWIGHLHRLAEAEQAAMARTRDASRTHYRAAQTGMLGLGLLTLLFGAACAIYITRSITRPLRHAAAVAGRIADGDLHVAVDTGADDEAGQLLGAGADAIEAVRGHGADRARQHGGVVHVA
jgi:methyl-accepting chemotaxis protein